MKKTLLILFILAAFFSMNRCSTDVDLYADYKDITIVYGLLNYTDDTAWVKITKAFVGPGNAVIMAQNPDSSNYPYKLDVKLKGVKQGLELDDIVFDTITIHNKRPNTDTAFYFYYPDQLMYYAVPGEDLDDEATYSLVIDNKGQMTSAETPMIPTFAITYPRNTIDFTSETKSIDWNSPRNGKRYDVFYVFNYQELRPGNDDTLNFQVLYPVGEEESKTTDGGENMSTGYSGDDFYSKLEEELPDIANVKRFAGDIDVYVGAGSQVLNNYLSINNSEGSLLTEVPNYTNISNGLGVFASRHTALRSTRLSKKSLDELVLDHDLGFVYPTKSE